MLLTKYSTCAELLIKNALIKYCCSHPESNNLCFGKHIEREREREREGEYILLNT